MLLHQPWPWIVGIIPVVGVLIVLSVIDIRTSRLPDRIVLPTIVGAAIWTSLRSASDGAVEPLLVAFCGAGVFFGALLLVHLVSPSGMGFGDVKLAALLGLLLAWCASSIASAAVLVLWALLISFALGTVAGLVILVRRRENRPFPFGPFLVVGTLATMAASGSILTGH